MQTPPQISQPPQPQISQPPQPSNNNKNQEILTCEICIEPIPFAEKKFRNGDKGCSHPFCTECIVNYIRAKLEDNVGRINCPSLTCDRTLSPRACESLVGPSLFVRWCDVLCEEAIGGLERCYCPNTKCSALIVNECSGIANKSKCPECKKLFCFKCKKAWKWHAGFACKENGETRDQNYVAFGRLAEDRKWMRCPRCRHFVDLEDGCRTVKCRCRISFCYSCGNQVKNGSLCRCDPSKTAGRWGCCDYFTAICALFVLAAFVALCWFTLRS